jgi:hypothetical protein
MNYLVGLLAALGGVALLYCTGAFVAMDWNAGNWHGAGRLLFVGFAAVLSPVLFAYALKVYENFTEPE